jgi:hypothetical protein
MGQRFLPQSQGLNSRFRRGLASVPAPVVAAQKPRSLVTFSESTPFPGNPPRAICKNFQLACRRLRQSRGNQCLATKPTVERLGRWMNLHHRTRLPIVSSLPRSSCGCSFTITGTCSSFFFGRLAGQDQMPIIAFRRRLKFGTGGADNWGLPMRPGEKFSGRLTRERAACRFLVCPDGNQAGR